MPTATLEELSNQHRSKKIGDGAETKETELMCCRDSGTKEWKIEKVEGEGACQVNCYWKTSYLTAEKYPWTRKNSSWNPRGERKKITADEHQPAWKLGSGNPLGERKKITADENQPARKVGSCGKRKRYSGWGPTSTKGWQLKPLRREKEDHSGWAPTSMKGWQLKSI